MNIRELWFARSLPYDWKDNSRIKVDGDAHRRGWIDAAIVVFILAVCAVAVAGWLA